MAEINLTTVAQTGNSDVRLDAKQVEDVPSDTDIRVAIVAWANIHGKHAARKLIKELAGVNRLADVPDRARFMALYRAMTAKEAEI